MQRKRSRQMLKRVSSWDREEMTNVSTPPGSKSVRHGAEASGVSFQPPFAAKDAMEPFSDLLNNLSRHEKVRSKGGCSVLLPDNTWAAVKPKKRVRRVRVEQSEDENCAPAPASTSPEDFEPKRTPCLYRVSAAHNWHWHPNDWRFVGEDGRVYEAQLVWEVFEGDKGLGTPYHEVRLSEDQDVKDGLLDGAFRVEAPSDEEREVEPDPASASPIEATTQEEQQQGEDALLHDSDSLASLPAAPSTESISTSMAATAPTASPTSEPGGYPENATNTLFSFVPFHNPMCKHPPVPAHRQRLRRRPPYVSGYEADVEKE